jgi:hypothetical protein
VNRDPTLDLMLAALQHARRHALSATELGVHAGVRGDRLDALLGELEAAGNVVVVEHPSPDIHLAGTDLRTVGAIDEDTPGGKERARLAAEAHWEDSLRSFLASHRCG